MEIKKLLKRPKTEQYPKTLKLFHKFEQLIEELRNKNLKDDTINHINSTIEDLNNSLAKQKKYHSDLQNGYNEVLKYIRKEEKIVPKNYYRNLWLAIGMSSFGIPIGLVFGLSFGNMAFLGVGLPIGMVIGIAVGTNMDNKALKENKQLDMSL
jgi:hypothetical protein